MTQAPKMDIPGSEKPKQETGGLFSLDSLIDGITRFCDSALDSAGHAVESAIGAINPFKGAAAILGPSGAASVPAKA